MRKKFVSRLCSLRSARTAIRKAMRLALAASDARARSCATKAATVSSCLAYSRTLKNDRSRRRTNLEALETRFMLAHDPLPNPAGISLPLGEGSSSRQGIDSPRSIGLVSAADIRQQPARCFRPGRPSERRTRARRCSLELAAYWGNPRARRRTPCARLLGERLTDASSSILIARWLGQRGMSHAARFPAQRHCAAPESMIMISNMFA